MHRDPVHTNRWGTTMKIVNRKTRKAIKKTVKKVVKKHGPKIAAGLAGGVVSTLATLAGTEAPGSTRRKSNLTDVAEKVSKMVAGDDGKKSRKRGAAKPKMGKGKRVRRSEEQVQSDEDV
jgi:hypothetical protein